MYLDPKGTISYRQEGEGWIIQLQNTCDEIYSTEQWEQESESECCPQCKEKSLPLNRGYKTSQFLCNYIERHSAKQNDRMVGK